MGANNNAGKYTGKSKSSRYYASNPSARKKKAEYESKYQSSKYRKGYRALLDKANRKNPNSKVGDGKDMSHKKDGGLVLENSSKNRARNRGKK
jgi:hypothetical protein